MGNEYIYIQDTERKTVTTENKLAKITVEENSELRFVVKNLSADGNSRSNG